MHGTVGVANLDRRVRIDYAPFRICMGPSMRQHTKILLTSLLCWLTGTAHAQSADDAALADSIRAMTSRSSDGLLQTTAADGTVEIDLQGRFRHAHVGQLGDDGHLRAQCVGSVAEANRFFGRDLDTGAALPQPKMSPQQLDDTANLHGMSAAEYAFYWGLIEQAKFAAPDAPTSSTITIQNGDGAGEGFNSTAAPFPDAGNNGATLGAQRLNLFNFAAGIWAAQLDSTRTTVVLSNFDPLAPCSAGGGVLGAAGPQTGHTVAAAPFASTLYPSALANKIANSDLNGATAEIGATFNSNVDTGCLGAGTRFYYGLDNATPAGRVNLLVVLLHELGHGFGFLSFTDEATGAYASGIPDVWARFMRDRTQNLTWFQMSAAQRAASAINVNNLLWDGPNVRIASSFLVAGREAATGRVELFTPNPLQPGSSVSHWNTAASPNLLMEPSITSGLPLTLDLTRQLMRDIGWFRDANNDAVADVISNVAPASGTLTVGSNVNITWTNPPGFSRNVTIELSTDGGTTFPTLIATDIANTGTRAWTVPNQPTAQARIRVREHDFVAPAGVSSANFTIGNANTAPTFTAAGAITRQRGSAAGAAVTVGTVADTQTPAGNLTVTQIAGGTATGMTVTGIANANGTVSAAVAANCSANPGTVRFQVSDGSLTGTSDLQVNVTANTAPTLTYANASVDGGANTSINPLTGPSDNGSISSVVVQSDGTYSGGISVAANGVISLTNAAPVGIHTITIRATDNCSTTVDASFQLTVNNTAPTFTPAAPIARQQGSINAGAATVGTVSDGQTAAGSVTVTQIAGGSATGISVGSISNAAGTISAPLSASCTANGGTLRFQASDGQLAGVGNLQIIVSANTPPTLAYGSANLAEGGGGNVNPTAGPSDNGSIASVALQSQGTYTGGISVSNNGVVTLTNASPAGVHSISVLVTDNCGSTQTGTFTLTVTAVDLFANGFE